MDSLTYPLFFFCAISGGLIVVAILVRVSRKRQEMTVEGYAKVKDYSAAASLAYKNGNIDGALEYYLLANQPLEAAKLAYRLGRLRQAAEFYQSAGELELAASMYREAGLTHEANKLLGCKGADHHDCSVADTPAKPEIPENFSTSANPGSSISSGSLILLPTSEKAGNPPPMLDGTADLGPRTSSDDIIITSEHAHRSVKHFRNTLAKARQGSVEAQNDLEELGIAAAESCLEAGESQLAADVFVEADLLDQAINIYVNVLGDPASAAALFTRKGDHRNAAALYEAAGAYKKALASWIRWAERAENPLLYLDEVDRLGEKAGEQLLDIIIRQRELTTDTAELYYRVAIAYEERKNARAAVDIYRLIDQILPGYREVSQKIGQLETMASKQLSPAPRRVALLPSPPIPDPSSSPSALGSLPEIGKDEQQLGLGQTAFQFSSPAEIDREKLVVLDVQQEIYPNHATDPCAPLDLDDEQSSEKIEAQVIKKLIGEVTKQVAREAAKIARPTAQPLEAEPTLLKNFKETFSKKASKALAPGIERRPVKIELAIDPVVRAARHGPSLTELKRIIGGASPDLGNIEVYYRLGLAQAAAGLWREALIAFQTVEDISPGYRDAGPRAQELISWQEAIDFGSENTSSLSQRYTLLGEIGRGGMAVVYRAQDTALSREVALKFLSAEVSNRKIMHELFQREARAAAQLNHPNIVTLYDAGTHNGRAFICMELVTGKTIEELLIEQGKLKVYDALRIAENILSALDYAHSNNIVHRDIKPSNMMRNDLGVVKLMDFGLAKSIEGRAKTTMVAGTPLYMAPEQFTGKNIDASTDVFSFGATLYQMLAGHPPFEGMRRDIPPAPLNEKNPAVPKSLANVVRKSLEIEKQKRYQHAGEMLQKIRKLLTAVRTFIQRQQL